MHYETDIREHHPISFPVFVEEQFPEWDQLYYWNCPTANYFPVQKDHGFCTKTFIERDDPKLIGVDGVSRRVTAINGQIPGPLLCVGYKDIVRVLVENHSSGFGYESTTIHWHGMFQKGTPWMDGPAYITQCPITAGQDFTYEFMANPPGTYWYHSHVGVQLADGAVGGLVVLPEAALNTELYGNVYHIDEPEQVMIVQDWQHINYQDVAVKHPGHWIDEATGLPISAALSIDGQFTGTHPFVSALINGHGRFNEVQGDSNMQPYIFKVRRGTTVRFRIISASAIYPFRVSIDNHRMTVISMDGFDVEPEIVDAVIVYPAERYDVTISAGDAGSDFWVRAETLSVFRGSSDDSIAPGTEKVLAILHYLEDGEDTNDVDPHTIFAPDTTSAFADSGRCKDEAFECRVVNCPFPEIYYDDANIECIQVGDFTRSHKISEVLLELDDDFPDVQDAIEKNHIVNLNFNVLGDVGGDGPDEVPNVEGIYFKHPPTAPLTHPDPFLISTMCQDDEPGSYESCTHVHSLEFGESYLFLLTNRWPVSSELDNPLNFPGIMPHPVHMHGHSFFVVASSAGTIFDPSQDVAGHNGCENGVGNTDFSNVCYDDQTRIGNLKCNESWGDCHINDWEQISLKPVQEAPQKDTIILPTHGYVIIAVKANNPGWWFMHCHIDIHMGQGMGVVLSEAEDETRDLVADKLPLDFPRCNNFRGENYLCSSLCADGEGGGGMATCLELTLDECTSGCTFDLTAEQRNCVGDEAAAGGDCATKIACFFSE